MVNTSLSIADDAIKVNVDNYVQAETALQFDRYVKFSGGTNKWGHIRLPTPLDTQNTIRMNRDTIYSFAVVDISKGAKITLPDPGERYMSVMVVNEDQYINKIFHKGGSYKLTKKEFDTNYVILVARILANPTDPADIKIANVLQDDMRISASSSIPYHHPKYDDVSYQTIYKLLLELSKGVTDAMRMFGKQDEVTETRYLLGAAFGWGGLPVYEAVYLTEVTPQPSGKFQLNVKDVPVDGFWSISIYNKDGYFEKNKFNSYSINNVTAKINDDKSYTIHFGGCEDGRINCLFIPEGWNYVVRLYRPHENVQKGEWTFPKPKAVK